MEINRMSLNEVLDDIARLNTLCSERIEYQRQRGIGEPDVKLTFE